MDQEEIQMHLRAGRAYGRLATCGRKQDYKSEGVASDAAALMTVKFNRDLEAYPCAWCDGWHIGRAMSPEERRMFTVAPEIPTGTPIVVTPAQQQVLQGD